jgi:riboflavin synthase
VFTGIVRAVGTVKGLTRGSGSAVLRVESDLLSRAEQGDSVSVSGVCLTVLKGATAAAAFDLGPETLAKTTLGGLAPGRRVNLELPLAPSDPVGGHFVQGHVDCVAKVVSRVGGRDCARIEFAAPPEHLKYVVAKGFVAVEGVSLTAVSVNHESFSVAIIPTTLRDTTLGDLSPGDEVNLEVDILAKYVERFVGSGPTEGITVDKLIEAGFF